MGSPILATLPHAEDNTHSMAAMVGGVITKVVEWVGADKVKVLLDRAGHVTEEIVKFQLYTVREGDSLEAIALAHGCCDWWACGWPFPGSAVRSGSDAPVVTSNCCVVSGPNLTPHSAHKTTRCLQHRSSCHLLYRLKYWRNAASPH